MFSRKVRNKCQKNSQNLLFLFLISIVLSLAGIHVFLLHTEHRFLHTCRDFTDKDSVHRADRSWCRYRLHNNRYSDADFP